MGKWARRGMWAGILTALAVGMLAALPWLMAPDLDFVCRENVSGAGAQLGLARSHPSLAEYERYVV